MWAKKAQGGEELAIWFVAAYAALTLAIGMALVIMPKSLMGSSINPVSMDQAVQAQQIKSRMWVTNEFTGTTNPFEYSDDLAGLNTTYAQKQITYRVSIPGKSTTADAELYDIAKPLAQYRYLPYVEQRTVNIGGKPQTIVIEEYYPKKYVIT